MDILTQTQQLEEVEVMYGQKDCEQPRRLLRALPTPMLSEIQAIYDETHVRGENKAAQVYARVLILCIFSICSGKCLLMARFVLADCRSRQLTRKDQLIA